MAPSKTQDLETPFTTGAIGTDVPFWRSYIAGRPSPTEDFFELINDYHTKHGDPNTGVAHDVGTGPGNIAERLAKYFDHVVGSDVNDAALAAAPAIVSKEHLQRMTFVKSPAEGLAAAPIPEDVGKGKTDLVVVSECMPLLDAPKALEAFHTLLRPGGTVAIYFYARPIFTGDDADKLNAIYDKIATRICTFLLPFKGTPGFPFHARGAEAMGSWLDNIEFPASHWSNVQRHKWNNDIPLLFNSKEGYDFEIERVDRTGPEDVKKEVIDRGFWAEEWDAERVAGYLASVYPNYRKKAGERYSEIEQMVEELREAMGGSGATRTVSFPVVLILATSK
ncbi:S-adenosyl-L-methionine-dependent methyltransferase [Trematosphaeria pertusa]|uniref:S-adenosyl-L-methionine-dependent methyltransferase n=1 Tax=Trematosphaeria pertusa TaxID=390896 RepID=A0A6A6I5G7_9PLEO|nr:S-adenosyl-L-methionine-dependent methyltransferase [Trematosphaeria pertusa]KAF2245591.1 S-adenosyl-L-methionine-dependent methyltransferase [Trematosphaeria pertusa]